MTKIPLVSLPHSKGPKNTQEWPWRKDHKALWGKKKGQKQLKVQEEQKYV